MGPLADFTKIRANFFFFAQCRHFYFFQVTLNGTIPTFNNPEKKTFYRTLRKCQQQAFSPFLKMFSTLFKRNFKCSEVFFFFFSSANVFNFDWSNIFSFGKEFTRKIIKHTSLIIDQTLNQQAVFAKH